LQCHEYKYLYFFSQVRIITMNQVYFKYDSLSRMIEKGIYKPGAWFPLIYNYYDDYDFNNDGNADFYYVPDSDFPDNQQHMNNIGRFTGTSVSLVSSSSAKSTVFLRTAIIYDKFDRIIQTHKENFVFGRGWDIFTNGYDFPGRMTKTKQTHNIGEPSKSEPITIFKLMEYDHGSRLTKLSQSINGKDLQEVSYQEYNSIGQLIKKSLNRTESNPSFQEIDYLYNIRGWLRFINHGGLYSNNDLFFMDIFYNEQINEPGFNSQPAYNGNISAIRWLSRSFPEFKAYLFAYDDLNRINQADYLKFNNGSLNSSTDYDVGDIKYDYNGNLQSMSTFGLNAEEKYEEIDDLTYFYSGNRLVGVNDEIELCSEYDFCDNGMIYDPNEPQTVEYHYDQNGNLIDDVNKGIVSIQYDHFNNMPIYFDLDGGRYIHFLYDASGVKWRKEVFEHGDLVETTDYVSGFVYTDSVLNYTLADEGRILWNGGEYTYEYQLKDHLGNVRVCFTDRDGNPYITQDNSYYPFGLQMKGLEFNSSSDPNKYLYNGKEMQFDHGLNWYDYGARLYDSQLGRWHSFDPLASQREWVSPYNFCQNNPISRIDPTGSLDDWYQDEDGTKQFDPNVKSQANLKGTQKYIGKTDVDKDATGNVTTNYIEDGSILFKNETDAYNRMWSQANDHYKKEKEVGGFVLSNNKVLVTPDYNNEEGDCTPSKYGYSISKNGYLSKGPDKWKITGQIHTHQDPSRDATPSYITKDGWGDVGYSRAMGGLPVFTIGHDGNIHGVYYSEKQKGYGTILELGSRSYLLTGKTKLAPWLKTYPTLGQ